MSEPSVDDANIDDRCKETKPQTPSRARAKILELSRTIQHYPQPGVTFWDLTPVFLDGPTFSAVVDDFVQAFRDEYDYVAGIEARGFLLASAVAFASGVGVIPLRKKGKLPREVLRERYQLEYGEAVLEMHRDDVLPGRRILLLDDVLATGGSLAAATRLLERAKLQVVGCGALLELAPLRGRFLLEDRRVHSLATV